VIILTIVIGAALIGFTTGNVIAQEVKLGANGGTPFISFEDALSSGMYEIRLNDGTGKFQIWDITHSRSVFLIGSNGNVGVGDLASTIQDFTIGCSSGLCNIQTRNADGIAQNTVKSLGGDGAAKFRIWDEVTSKGQIIFDITSRDDGTICLGDPNGEPCMMIFDINGTNPGQVKQANGSCIANCS